MCLRLVLMLTALDNGGAVFTAGGLFLNSSNLTSNAGSTVVLSIQTMAQVLV
jgi:hypothetical protein